MPNSSVAAEASAVEVAEASVAGPGFINLRLTDDTWRAELAAIVDGGDNYGRSTRGSGVTVNAVLPGPTGEQHVAYLKRPK